MTFIDSFIHENQLDKSFSTTAKKYYLPLANKLVQLVLQKQRHKLPFYLGINGAQGSGKSTLTLFLSQYLEQQYHLNVASISLDDFYLDKISRRQLATNIHPLLATRGVPGTHNINLLTQTLKVAQQQGELALPRFDKAEDNPVEAPLWPRIKLPIDVVILEGWCWGVPAQQQIQLNTPINPLEENQDNNCIWRQFVNQQLANNYQPLYQLMDHWLMLQAPSFDCVAMWRWQQEQHLALSLPPEMHNKLMSEQQVIEFTQYFQRLTEHSLVEMPSSCQDVFLLNNQRTILNWRQN